MRDRLVATSAAVLVGGCVDLVPGEPVALVNPYDWVRVTGERDPFAGEGGTDDGCPVVDAKPYDFGGEISFDIDTDGCSRVTVEQRSAVPIGTNDVIALRAWHEMLTAVEPATAVLALAIGGEEMWRWQIEIPKEQGGPVLGERPAPRDWPAGTPIAWHIHNHGKNSYHLLDVVVRPLVPASSVTE